MSVNGTKRTFYAKASGALALACSATLVLGATAAPAPANTAGRQAAESVANCLSLISGTPWNINHGAISGNKYIVTAHAMPCSGLARTSALKFMKLSNPGLGKTFRGPSGFACHSMMPTSVGAKLVGAICRRQSGSKAFFGWAPKVN
jgi:hypothetical protein